MAEHEPSDSPGYERSDASVRPVVMFTLALTLVVIVVILMMTAFYNHLERAAAVGGAHPMATPVEPPAPRLQTATGDDLAAQRARESALLHQYGWVDRQAGTVRIPIERALDLVVERGLPVRK